MLETALDMPGEDLRGAVTAAVGATDRLERTIDDLLALARDITRGAEPLHLPALLAELAEHWRALLALAGRGPARGHAA